MQLIKMLSLLDISIFNGHARVGFLTFDHEVRVEFRLSAYENLADLFSAIENVVWKHGYRTRTSAALKLARTVMFTQQQGDRPDVPNVILLVSDGQSQEVNDTILQATMAKKTGIRIFTVGIGFGINFQELKNVASSPPAEHFFVAETFESTIGPFKKIADTLPCLSNTTDSATGAQGVQGQVEFIYPPGVLHLDGFGMSSVEKLDKRQEDTTMTSVNESDRWQAGCPDTHFQCPRGFCIPTYLLNNQVKDCPSGQDEDIAQLTCPGFYRCQQTENCLHPKLLCDKVKHCPLNDDERYCHDENCPENCACEGQAFKCRSDFDFRAHLQLRYVDLSGSDSPKLDQIESLEYLQVLNLSSCNITDLTLTALTQLRILDLSRNKIRGFEFVRLESLKELLHLNLSFNPLAKVLDHVFTSFVNNAQMFKLRTLTMVDIGLELIMPDVLTSLRQISVLDITHNPVDVIDTDVFATTLQTLYTDNPKLCCSHFHPTPLRQCYAPPDELSSCSDLLRFDFLRVLLWIISVMAMTGNLGVLIYRGFLEQQGSSMAYKVFVVNLSTADFFMGIYMALIGGADIVFRDIYVLKEKDWRSGSVCKAAGFLAMVSSEVSAFVICLITLDRFFSLRFPFSRRLRMSRLSALLACAAAWAAGVVLASLPLFQSHWRFYGQNSICLPLPITRRQFAGQQYAFGVFIVLNFILFLLIGAGQVSIYQAIHRSSKATKRGSRKQETAVARRLFLVVFTDFCCWFPIGVMGLLAAQGTRIPSLVNVWAAVFVLPLNSAINPFLYTLNTLLERRANKKEEKRMAKMMSNLQAEISTWPCEKVMELTRHYLMSQKVNIKDATELLHHCFEEPKKREEEGAATMTSTQIDSVRALTEVEGSTTQF